MAHEDQELGIDEFLNHKTSGGGGAKFLSKWKDRKKGMSPGAPPASADVLLHTKCGVRCIWRHNLPTIVTFESRETKKTESHVWSRKYVCHEVEATLRKQYKRNHDGTREAPPERCGLCRLIEHIRGMVDREELAWTDPVFEFTADDSDEDATVLAGHLYNAFGGDKLGPDELDDLKKHKVRRDKAWQLNAMPKAEYVFRVVDVDDLGKGVQIAVEAALLGDKVQRAIADEMERNDDGSVEGRRRGDPTKNPYVIRWKYLSDEQEFNKKYAATAMVKRPIPEDALRLITDTDPPSIDGVTERFNAKSMRAMLEEHCRLDRKAIPWDALFGARDLDDDKPEHPASRRQAEAPARRPEPEPKVPPVEEVQMVECDDCEQPMRVTDPKCANCGKVYEIEPAPEPPKPKLAKRSEVAKAAAPAKAAPAKQTSFVAPAPDPLGDDDIPF